MRLSMSNSFFYNLPAPVRTAVYLSLFLLLSADHPEAKPFFSGWNFPTCYPLPSAVRPQYPINGQVDHREKVYGLPITLFYCHPIVLERATVSCLSHE